MKICLTASTGGHLTQLLRLREVWEGKSHFFVIPGAFVAEELKASAKTYVVNKADYRHPWQLLLMLARCTRIMVRERPDVVISTGAAVGCILCVLAKLGRKKVVWIDTVSHVDRLTLSGKIVRHLADLFLVQWPELAERYRQAKYVGSVL